MAVNVDNASRCNKGQFNAERDGLWHTSQADVASDGCVEDKKGRAIWCEIHLGC